MTNQHFHMHLLLYKVNVYILSLVVFISSSSSYVSSSRQLYMGINTYDPFTNLEYIFASPTQSSNFSKDGRLFQVGYNTRQFQTIPLQPAATAFTTIEFDPETSSLLGTFNVVGKKPEFGQIDVATGKITSYGELLNDYTLKIGVSAFDAYRFTYYICGRNKNALNDGDFLIKINLIHLPKNNSYVIRKMSVLKPDVNSLEALEIVQVEINTKYNNVNVLQAVALNLIFADKNSNQNLGWKKMMLDYGDEEFPSTSEIGNDVKESGPLRKEKSVTMLKELEKLFIGNNSKPDIDILDHFTMEDGIILSTDDYNMTEPVPVNSGISLFVLTGTEFKSFLSADSLGPTVAPQFALGYPKLVASTNDGYKLDIKTNKISVVSIVAVNIAQLRNLKNASLNATVAPAEENIVSLGLGADGKGEFLDGIRSGVELFINRPSDIMAATIDKIPCNTDIQIYYISRYGFKAKTLVEQLVLPNNQKLPRIGCKAGDYCPNTEHLGNGLDKVNEECAPCNAGEYQPNDDAIVYSCSKCKPGFIQPLIGQKTCNPCPLGTESGNSTLECTPCPMGYYAPCTNTSKCLKCPEGQTTWDIGSYACATERIVLPAPTNVVAVAKTNSMICVSWNHPLKEKMPTGFNNITKYVVAQSLTSQFTLEDAMKTSIASCTSSSNCSYCFKPNKMMYKEVLYVRVAGMVEFTGIGAASATSEGWTTAKDCGNDRYLDDSETLLTNWECRDCPRGADCTGESLWKDVRAKFGYYRLDEIDKRGTKEIFWPCINPKACLGGTNNLLRGKYFDEDGKDMALLDGPEICNYELGFETNCGDKTSNDTSLHKTCRLCRACRPGYWEAGVGECVACPPEWLNTIVVGFAFLFIVFIVAGFLRTALKQNEEDLNHSHHHYAQSLKKIVINHLQLISLATGFPLKWPDSMSNYFRFLNAIGSAGEYVFNPSCSLERRGPDTIKTSTFFLHQATVLSLPLICIFLSGCVWTLVALNNWFKANQTRQRKRRAQRRLNQRGFMLGFDESESSRKKRRKQTRENLLQVKSAWEQKTSPNNSPKNATDKKKKKTMSSISPTSVLPSSAIRRGKTLDLKLLNKQIKNKIKINTFDKFITTSVTLLYLLYPTVCKATFAMNACRYVGDVEYLVMDMSINCNSEEHLSWIYNLWVPSIFIYVLGLPFVAWLLLYRHKKSLHQPRIMFRFGILFSGYEKDAYYWESIIALRKASIIVISAVFSILGTEAQALVAILTTLGFALLHLQCKPFVRVMSMYDTLDAAESWALVVAILTLWCGLFYFQDVAATGAIPVVLTFVLMGFNLTYFIIVTRWFLIFKLMDLHSARRHLPVGKQRSGLGGSVMVLMEYIVPSWVSRTTAKWRHARAKLRIIVKIALYLKEIRRKNEAAHNAKMRKKHLKHRNLRKEDLLPHRSRIAGIRSRMRKIEMLKSKLLPFAKDGKARTRDPTRVTPRRQSGRYTPTRIYPMGIPSPSIGRRTPTPSRRSRITPTPSRSSSRNRRRSPTPQKSSLMKISPSSNLRNKSRKEQAQIMQDIAVKRLAQRQKAMEARQRKLEEMKDDPQYIHRQKLRKLKVAMDTQQFAKHGLRKMLENQVRKLATEKTKLRAQIEKLMKLGKAKKLSKAQVDKLKQTMKLLKGKYEAIIKKEKAVQTRLKHI